MCKALSREKERKCTAGIKTSLLSRHHPVTLNAVKQSRDSHAMFMKFTTDQMKRFPHGINDVT